MMATDFGPMMTQPFECTVCGKVVEVTHPMSGPYSRLNIPPSAYPPGVEPGFDGKRNTIRCSMCPGGPDMERV